MKPWIRALFSRDNLRRDLRDALLVAGAFSAFLYLEHFGLRWELFNTLAGLTAVWGLLHLGRRAVLLAGFFIGLFWFYWVGFSFRYYDLTWMVPFVSLAFATGYMLIFGTLTLTRNPFLRGLLLFGIGYFEPFDFNWMQPALPFLHSYLGTAPWQFALVLAVLALFVFLERFEDRRRYLALLPLLGALNFLPSPAEPLPPLKIKLVAAELPQGEKWVPANRARIVRDNLRAIDAAAREGYDLVVLPEAAFPLFLNKEPDLLATLRERSRNIAIVVGALLYEEGRNYNVTYRFDGGELRVARKMVLVPFGEYIPLPGFLHRIVNDIFFNGASDYVGADAPTDLTIRGVRFRNAICYEATCPELFEDAPPYMIAISNNAWFTPSIEPTLQRLLMEYYARKHGTIVFHAANMAGSGVIR